MEITKVKISLLEPNRGQIPGLPENPRQWSPEDVENLAHSLIETPELFEARPIIAIRHEGKLVILGGNMRYEASVLNKAKEVPCYIIHEGTPIPKLKEIVIKDNGSFGAWAPGLISKDWGDLPLPEWGVPAWLSSPVDESAVDHLFEPNTKAAPEEIKLQVTIPAKYKDSIPDILAAIEAILEEWPGCSVK